MRQPNQTEEGHVLTCAVTNCSFNENEVCYAAGIDVGETEPVCDTFTTAPVYRSPEGMPDVSLCNITQCRFNQDKDCAAPGITVAYHGNLAECMTFRSGE